MKYFSIYIFCFIILANSCNNKDLQTNEELSVYNDIIDSIYAIYPQKINFIPPVGTDSILFSQLLNDNETQIDNRKKFLDSLELITITTDSLMELSIYPNFIKQKIDSSLSVIFTDLMKDSIVLVSKDFDIGLLKQKKVSFIKINNFHRDTIIDILINKKYGKKYYLGILELSRVLFDKTKTICILECGFIYAPKSGVGYIYLLKKENNKWIIKQKIMTWEA
jgi:hypothetical protein